MIATVEKRERNRAGRSHEARKDERRAVARATVAVKLTMTIKSDDPGHPVKMTTEDESVPKALKKAANGRNESIATMKAAAAAMMTPVNDGIEKRKARRKRANERRRAENDLPKMTPAVTTTRPVEVPSRERKLRCILKRMKKTWPTNEPGRSCFSS